MWISGLSAGLASSAALMAYAVRHPASSLLAPSVYHGVRTRRSIALTFDDGPSESTPALLDLLAEHNVKATFFACGANVRRLPEVARSVVRAGHEIGNHSDTHPLLCFRSGAFIQAELERAQSAICEATGVAPTLFRAPFGVRWFGLRGAQRRLGLAGVMWTRIGVDWKWPEAAIVSHLVRGARNGAVFCLHDGRELTPAPDIRATLGAVRSLIPRLMSQGFQFEKVSEILCPTT